ncbi:MAG: transporter [Haloferacaceae archaeon]
MDRVDRRTALTAAAAGAAAYLLGYLVTYVTRRDAIADRLRGFNFVADLFGGDPIPTWKAVGWLFYNAHLVETTIPGFGGARTVNFLADGGFAPLYLLPPTLLLGAGVAVARLGDRESPTAGAVAGALVVVGYLPLALVGAVVVGHPVGDGRIGPDLVTAGALAGLVYPAVLGAIGGTVGGVVAGRG